MLATHFRLVSAISLVASSCGDDGCMPSVQRWVSRVKGVNDHVPGPAFSGVNVGPPEFQKIMPNRFQWVFVSSFAFTLAFLLLVSHLITTKLREAGYPVSHIILIGLDKEDTKSQQTGMSLATPALLLTASLVILTILYNKLFRSST